MLTPAGAAHSGGLTLAVIVHFDGLGTTFEDFAEEEDATRGVTEALGVMKSVI